MEEKHILRLRINLLGITGVLIGLSTLFMPWFTSIGQLPGSPLIEHGLIDSMTSSGYIFMGDRVGLLIVTMYLISLAIAIISPAGGIIQTAVILLYIFDRSYVMGEGITPIWIAPIVGLASGIISLIALIHPLGIGFDVPLSMKEKLWNFIRL